MKRFRTKSYKGSAAGEPAKRPSLIERLRAKSKHERQQLTSRQEKAKAHGLEAINLVRKGRAKTLSAAARATGTTVKSIQNLLPAALKKSRRAGRIQVTAGDSYSQLVEIVTSEGRAVVTARGSRERDLAGRYLATWPRVLRKKLPPSALEEFTGKKIGGYELLSDYETLRKLARAGALGQLEGLYVAPSGSK